MASECRPRLAASGIGASAPPFFQTTSTILMTRQQAYEQWQHAMMQWSLHRTAWAERDELLKRQQYLESRRKVAV